MTAQEPALVPVLGVYCFLEDQTDQSKELQQLALTAGYGLRELLTQERRKGDPRYLFGKGKVKEIAECHRKLFEKGEIVFSPVLVGNVLTPKQLFNLEREIGVEIRDKTRLILDIFEGRPNTQATQLQINQMRMLCDLPMRKHRFQRQTVQQRKGSGTKTTGGGPSPLEALHMEADSLQKRTRQKSALHQSRVARQLQSRQRSAQRLIALVGYTGSGKTSLLNALADQSLEVSKGGLFTTLDTITRRLSPKTGVLAKFYLVTDTVGFMEGLDSDFIEAFRSTLQHTGVAHHIIAVLDGSEPVPIVLRKFQTTLANLTELEADLSHLILCINKRDLLTPQELTRVSSALREQYPQFPLISISAKNEDYEELADCLRGQLPTTRLVITVKQSTLDRLGRFLTILRHQFVVLAIHYQEETTIEILVEDGVTTDVVTSQLLEISRKAEIEIGVEICGRAEKVIG